MPARGARIFCRISRRHLVPYKPECPRIGRVDLGNLDQKRLIHVVTVPTMSKVVLKLLMSPAQIWQERHSGDSNPVPVPWSLQPGYTH
jgi:hypothetical protein